MIFGVLKFPQVRYTH